MFSEKSCPVSSICSLLGLNKQKPEKFSYDTKGACLSSYEAYIVALLKPIIYAYLDMGSALFYWSSLDILLIGKSMQASPTARGSLVRLGQIACTNIFLWTWKITEYIREKRSFDLNAEMHIWKAKITWELLRHF